MSENKKYTDAGIEIKTVYSANDLPPGVEGE